ncbi:hypothetical protein CPL00172_CDS0026 [Escherichia phage BubbaBully]
MEIISQPKSSLFFLFLVVHDSTHRRIAQRFRTEKTK